MIGYSVMIQKPEHLGPEYANWEYPGVCKSREAWR